MDNDLIALIIIASSVIFLTVSATHLAFVILSLCSGYILSTFVGPSLSDFINNFIGSNNLPILNIVNITLLLIPPIMIGYRFKKTQKGVGRFIQQLLPALALTMLAAVFIVDLLPNGSVDSVRRSSYLAGGIEGFAPMLVIFAISVALFDVLIKHANDPIRKKRGPGRPKK